MDIPKKIRSEDAKTFAILVGIFLIAFSIVYISHGPRLSDPDAWHYYRYVNWIVEDGRLPEVDPLQYYPTGSHPASDNLVHSYMVAYGYKLFKPFGMPLMEYLMIAPAIFGGGLAAVALYLAVKEMFGKKVGFLAALLYSFIPLSLTRVYSGTIDKEIVYGFLMYSTLYLFLRAYREGIYLRKPRSFIIPVLGGIFYGLSYASWSGATYTILFVSVATVLFFVNKLDTNLMKALLILSIVGPVTMHILQPDKYAFSDFSRNANTLIPFAISFMPLFSIYVSKYLNKSGKGTSTFQVFVVTSLLVAGGLTAAGEGDLIPSTISGTYGLLFSEQGAQEDVYMATVAESQPSNFLGPAGDGVTLMDRIKSGNFYSPLQLMLFVLPFALLLMLMQLKRNKKNYGYYIAIVWVVSGFLAANQGHRYMFFLAPSSVTAAAFIFMHYIEKSRSEERNLETSLKSAMKPKRKAEAEKKLSNARTANIMAIVLTMLVTLSTLNSAVGMMSARGSSDLHPAWLGATMWAKENTPENSVIIFWWDYGYYFQAIAERATVADGGGNVPVNINLSHMFTSPEEGAMEYIENFVNYTEVPTYMLVSYEEFGKSGAINHIDKLSRAVEQGITPEQAGGRLLIGASDIPPTGNRQRDEQEVYNFLAQTGITSYKVVNMGDRGYRIWYLADGGRPEMKDRLLAKLLPFNTGCAKGLKHFELVYGDCDRSYYILIYRIV